MGRSEPEPTDGACWGPMVEVCGAPGVMQTRRARPVVLIPTPVSCPWEERRGFGGRSAGMAAGTGRRHGVRTRGGRGGKEEGAAGMAFPRVCVTEEARASGHALLSRCPSASISQQRRGPIFMWVVLPSLYSCTPGTVAHDTDRGDSQAAWHPSLSMSEVIF